LAGSLRFSLDCLVRFAFVAPFGVQSSPHVPCSRLCPCRYPVVRCGRLYAVVVSAWRRGQPPRTRSGREYRGGRHRSPRVAAKTTRTGPAADAKIQRWVPACTRRSDPAVILGGTATWAQATTKLSRRSRRRESASPGGYGLVRRRRPSPNAAEPLHDFLVRADGKFLVKRRVAGYPINAHRTGYRAREATRETPFAGFSLKGDLSRLNGKLVHLPAECLQRNSRVVQWSPRPVESPATAPFHQELARRPAPGNTCSGSARSRDGRRPRTDVHPSG